MNQKELDIQILLSDNQIKINQANKERDNAIKKADIVAKQCEKDNQVAADYRQKAEKEYKEYCELKQNQINLINQSAESKIRQHISELQSSYDTQITQHKEMLYKRYVAHEGYHGLLAITALIIFIYHTIWLESFRTDIINAIIWAGKNIWNLIVLVFEIIEYIWCWFSGFENPVVTILCGIILNGIFAIAVISGIGVGLIVLVRNGWAWFEPKFINRKSGYLCLGISMGLITFSDMIKPVCPINLFILLILINLIVFIIRYLIGDY